MFGHDHKDEDKKDEDLTVQPMSTQPVSNGLLGIDDDEEPMGSGDTPALEPSAPPVVTAPSDDPVPQDTASVSPAFSEPATAPAPMQDDQPAVDQSEAMPAPATSSNDDLLNIKKEALEELSPLIDHLDQSAEEKFRTTMMMIQASDNQSLLPQAFAAAKQITDDKKRAQALLDIVNEINYFTHQKSN